MGIEGSRRGRAQHKSQLVFDLISEAISSVREAYPSAASEARLINHGTEVLRYGSP